MEYECIFPDLAVDAWVGWNDLQACSNLKHIEINGNERFDYVMGLDCARVDGGDNTILKVYKMVRVDDHFEKEDVYTLSMNGESFPEQNRKIRAVLKRFPKTKMIVMDTSGLGVGLLDELSKPYLDIDGENQVLMPALTDRNDKEMLKKIPEGVPLIYGIKFDAETNHRIGMAIKTNTQKRYLHLYANDAGDDVVMQDMELSDEEEHQILEAEATRREIASISAKPNGLFYKFETTSRSHKDRWTATGLALIAADEYEKEHSEDEDDSMCVGVINRRND
jgi:hypothetical protein